MYQYQAKIIRVVDGDTVHAEVDLGFKASLKIEIRLFGVDTPELHSKSSRTRKKANQAFSRTKELLKDPNITMQSFKPYKTDKYGRWVALIVNSDGVNLTDTLLKENLGVPLDENGHRLKSFEDLPG